MKKKVVVALLAAQMVVTLCLSYILCICDNS